MRGVVYFHQQIDIYVRVSLRRRQALVAQHLLNGSQVRASIQKVGCKTVPEPMRTKVLP